jgi:DNA-binding CsgD family transcriptional regulator
MGKSSALDERLSNTESIRGHGMPNTHQREEEVGDAVAPPQRRVRNGSAERVGTLDPHLALWLSRTLERAAAPPVADRIVQTLVEDVDAVASFGIIWPSEFAFTAASLEGARVRTEDLFTVPRVELLSAFGIQGLGTGSLSTSWHIERLPASLHRSPFIVPGTTKLALPISWGGYPLGIVGIAFASETGAIRRFTAEDAYATATRCPALEDWPEMTVDDPEGRPTNKELPRAGSEKALSPRELQIARHLAEGYTTLNIAAILGVSPNTVRTHIRRAYTKLGVCSRIELLRRLQ